MSQSTIEFEGTFYDGQSSERRRANARATAQFLDLNFPETPPAERQRFEPCVVKIGSRLGNTPRSLQLPNGALLETDDNEAVDQVESLWNRSRLRPHLFESSTPFAALAVLIVALFSAAAYKWGVPLAAKHVAYSIPDDVAHRLGAGTLETLDRILFAPSALSPHRMNELRTGFSKMKRNYPALPLHLVYRQAKMPNAFALPNGTVIVTDELVELAHSDEEIYAVLAHEIGHVEHRHAARIALESSALGLLAMLLVGDASQVAGFLGALPAIYANAQFSQSHETEADTFALEYMRKSGLRPGAFADILERMSKETGEPELGALQYLSSHPATPARIQRFRQ